MKLYHGSNEIIEKPCVNVSRANLDFGRGFYLTSCKDQAVRWAKRKALRSGGDPFVSVYDFDEKAILETKTFPENNEEWVEFVCACRSGDDNYKQFDLIVGGVADDQVFRAVDMYYRGIWDLETTLQALVFYERNDQYCFVSQKAIDSALHFVEAYEVSL